MNQLEDRIVTALRDRAPGGVEVTDLLAASRQRGQVYRRRRRTRQAGGGALVAVLAILGTAVAAPRLAWHRHGPVGPGTGVAAPATSAGSPSRLSQSSPAGAFRPPVATAPPATADPTVVGADPGLLHFDIATAAVPVPVALAQWTSVDGLERLILQAGSTVPESSSQVQVSRERSALDPLGEGPVHQVRVGSRPATLGGSRLVWQPVDGVWAEVQAPGDEAAVIRFAEAVTFDHVLRCVVPFRLTWVPAGTALEACNMLFASTGVSGSATVAVGNSALTVEVDRGGTAPAPTTTINGRPATVRRYPGDGGAPVLQVDLDYRDHVVDLLAEGHYDQATVLRIAEGYRDVAANPDSWPASPLG
jgi:hypothetical protein